MFDMKHLEQLEHIIRKTKSKSGVSCNFYQITEQVGAKLYSDSRDRDEAHRWQNEAFLAGVGPEPGPQFKRRPTTQQDDTYGYLTEICPHVFGELIEEEMGIAPKEYHKWRKWHDDSEQLTQEWIGCFPELAEHVLDDKLYEMGLGELTGDLHMWNIGLMGDGSVVVIDFM